MIESNSNHTSPSGSGQKVQKKTDKTPKVNNIIINNYNGNVLKNITNLEPYSNKNFDNKS